MPSLAFVICTHFNKDLSDWCEAIPHCSFDFPFFNGILCVHPELLSCVWLFATLWTVACQAPLSMEFSRQEYWSGLLFAIPRDLPNPGIRPASSPLAGRFLPLSHQGSPMKYFHWFILINLPSSACKRVTKDFFKSVVSSDSFCFIRKPEVMVWQYSPLRDTLMNGSCACLSPSLRALFKETASY